MKQFANMFILFRKENSRYKYYLNLKLTKVLDTSERDSDV